MYIHIPTKCEAIFQASVKMATRSKKIEILVLFSVSFSQNFEMKKTPFLIRATLALNILTIFWELKCVNASTTRFFTRR